MLPFCTAPRDGQTPGQYGRASFHSELLCIGHGLCGKAGQGTVAALSLR